MRRLLVLVLVLFAACSRPAATVAPTQVPATPAAQAQSADDYVRIYGGATGVYRSILDETDCDELQEQFYTATDNDTTGYQAAITDRAAEVGCPDLRFTRP